MFNSFEFGGLKPGDKQESESEKKSPSFVEKFRDFANYISELRERFGSGEDIVDECELAMGQIESEIQATNDPQEKGLYANQQDELKRLQLLAEANRPREAA